MFVIKDIIDKEIEKVSEFYDVETLTEDKLQRELKRLYRRYERLNEVLAMMERFEGQHPDLMEFYEERGKIEKKIIVLENYYGYRHNFFIKAVLKKGANTKSILYANYDDWEVK